MNGKILIRLVESALAGNVEQAKMAAKLLSSDLAESHPELSRQIATASASSALRGSTARVNPHHITENHQSNLYWTEKSSARVERPILSESINKILGQVLSEHTQRKKLLAYNLEPIKTMLFTGPPGVGKTLSAQWIAQELNVPLIVLDLANVMSSQLGKTGNNLKAVIDRAAAQPCVLLLDEFDSIAKKRNDDGDIGELKRLVTVLLQAIDSWPNTSLLIAATNHAELLDPAIWRRFEEKIVFSNPDDAQIKMHLHKLTKSKKIAELFPVFRGLSFSEIKTTIIKNTKISLINDLDLTDQIITGCISEKLVLGLSKNEKKELAASLVGSNISQRQVSKLLNVSRPTIRKALTESGLTT